MQPPSQQLSTNDQEILDSIFSQELYGLPSNVGTKEQIKNRALRDNERAAAQLEIKAIEYSETENYDQALALLDESIAQAPKYPSPHNNKAQILRLLRRDDEALQVLNQAIQLCDELAEEQGNDPFPLVRRQAISQRAWLRYTRGEEEAAQLDFNLAAQLGSKEAKQMAIRCNPYARLCNNIMNEMLRRLYYSRPTDMDGDIDDKVTHQ